MYIRGIVLTHGSFEIHWKEGIPLCWRRYRHSPKGSSLRSDGVQFGSHKRTINASSRRGHEKGGGGKKGSERGEKNIDIRLGIFLEGKRSSSSSREQVFRARIEQVQSCIAPATVAQAQAQVITPTAKFALSPLSNNYRTKEYLAVVAVFLSSHFLPYCVVIAIHACHGKNCCSFYNYNMWSENTSF